ncbi:MAG: SDR family oxidoreductase [Pseudomonadota bacterium]
MKKKICIVTHVTSGVGQGSADALAKTGATVVVNDRRFQKAADHKAYAKKHPKLHVTKTLDPETLVAEVVKKHGRVDVVVSNALSAHEPAIIEKTKPAALQAYLDRLAIEPFRLAKAAVFHMRKRKSGKIIFVTSNGPRRGLAKHTAYCAAQGTANALMISMAEELADANVQVNAIGLDESIRPTYFPKEMMGETTAETTIYLKNKPMRKAKPQEAGGLVAFLASEGSDFVTGQVIPFTGGWA